MAFYVLNGCIFHNMVQKGVTTSIKENLLMEDLPVSRNEIETESSFSVLGKQSCKANKIRSLDVRSSVEDIFNYKHLTSKNSEKNTKQELNSLASKVTPFKLLKLYRLL